MRHDTNCSHVSDLIVHLTLVHPDITAIVVERLFTVYKYVRLIFQNQASLLLLMDLNKIEEEKLLVSPRGRVLHN